MGKLVLSITVLLFVFFVMRGVRQWKQQVKRENVGYCVLVKQYEENGQYYGIFQQGDKEWCISYPVETFLALTPLTRGELILEAGQFYAFVV